MLFGLRFDLRNPPFAGVSASERAQAALDMCEWADQRGAMALTVSEHHGSDDGYLPSPLVMAAAIAARTKTSMITVAAIIAPFHDPIRLAEDAAVVDLISGGRLVLIVGGGYLPSEFEMFGVPMSERPKRVRDAFRVCRAAWSGEPFEHEGRTVSVFPTPTNPGGPIMLMGGTSEGAARRAARIADGFVPSEPECWEHYRDESVKLGKPDPGPCPISSFGDQLVLAEDVESAWDELGPYFLYETQAYGAWESEAASREGRPPTFRPMASVEEVRESGQYRILTPDEWAKELAEAEGDQMPVFHPMVGGIPPALAWRHLRLFENAFLD
jgi:alkanesulfonate monooxygenase SsuD/methylene tetrahydromethanopterin reductase-like flavin-dependent oxidoreductase (luciferase family)